MYACVDACVCLCTRVCNQDLCNILRCFINIPYPHTVILRPTNTSSISDFNFLYAFNEKIRIIASGHNSIYFMKIMKIMKNRR